MNAAVLYDGECALCSRLVRFLLARDRRAIFQYRSLQDPATRAWLTARGHPHPPDSVVVVEGDRLYFRSAAALAICRHLGWPWSWLNGFGVLPERWRDAGYDALARRRYRWFGREAETCDLFARLPAERVWNPPALP